MTGTVSGNLSKSFKQYSKILKDHLQKPVPNLKDLTINIWLFVQFKLILLHFYFSVIIQ